VHGLYAVLCGSFHGEGTFSAPSPEVDHPVVTKLVPARCYLIGGPPFCDGLREQSSRCYPETETAVSDKSCVFLGVFVLSPRHFHLVPTVMDSCCWLVDQTLPPLDPRTVDPGQITDDDAGPSQTALGIRRERALWRLLVRHKNPSAPMP
jgi:hypothetical protein